MKKPYTVEDHLAMVRVVGLWRCWRLPQLPGPAGYVIISMKHRSYRAHRVIFEHLIGPIDRGLPLDHLCRHKWCCNPNHVAPVTHQINILRGIGPSALNAQKTRCPFGHPYDVENTRVFKGHRYCRICSCRRSAQWRRSRGAQPLRQSPVRKIQHLLLKGCSYGEVANRLHVSYSTIAKVKKNGFSTVEE